MKGWESQLPASFPIDRLLRDAVADAERRKHRRRRRYRAVTTGSFASLLIASAVVFASRNDPPEQVRAGPGPAPTPTSEVREGGLSADVVAPVAANGKIAFIRSTGPDDAAPKLYVMHEDGSEQTMIAETTQGSALTWSPDGARLAFSDVGGIYVVNADGSGEQRVPGTSRSDQWPAWSPDGTKLAVRSLSDDMTGGIYLVNVDGSGRKQLTDGMMDVDPTWSPDGTRIAFSRFDDIFVVNADGSSLTRLARIEGIEDAPAWSPDGRQIAFRHNSTISVVDVDGGRARQLVSPGGTALADPAGRGANKLAVGRGDPNDPQWSPDGTRIAFTIFQTGENCSIWVMNADGSGQSQLTDNRTCDRDPAWQPLP